MYLFIFVLVFPGKDCEYLTIQIFVLAEAEMSVTLFSLSGVIFLLFFSSFKPSICLVSMGRVLLKRSSRLTASRTCKERTVTPQECDTQLLIQHSDDSSPAASPCWRCGSWRRPRPGAFLWAGCPAGAGTWPRLGQTCPTCPRAAQRHTKTGSKK